MSGTLVLPEAVARVVDAVAAEPLETAGVILATFVPLSDGGFRLLAREIHLVPEADYFERRSDRLSIRSTGWVPALAEAERLGAVPIWFHTHPTVLGVPRPSAADRVVDKEIADLFRDRSGSDYYGALIVSPRQDGLAFSATLTSQDGQILQVDRLWQVGEAWRLHRALDYSAGALSPIFDRNIRAFGQGVQDALGDLSVAVVGCGGTGSVVAEQLVRLGVRNLKLIDGDTLSASNVTRVYGSTAADVGLPKPEVLRAHLQRIAPELQCEAIMGRITQETVARRLIDRDLVFGCTDDNAGRLVLSRFASYLMTPVIDVGVLLSSGPEGAMSGIDGRVTLLTPGSACLVCRNRVDLQRAAVEQRDPDERHRLQDEGYAPALGQVEPAVVAYTTAVAAAAINELLDRLVGYGPAPRPTELLLRIHEREISGNRMTPRDGHYCDVESGKLGAGPCAPFLEQIWVDQ